mmetsp:Transcript_8555/g.12495  ORF Transcript_8555/g.12495 Transcript_8555/m.12495 type:complete len:238 (-) Transcript_8555:1018-1731(-)
MHSNNLFRSFGTDSNVGNGNGRRIGSKNGVVRCDGFDICHNLTFQIQIFKDSFNNQIGLTKVSFPTCGGISKWRNVGGMNIVLILCHAFARNLLFPIVLHIGLSTCNALHFRILQEYTKTLFSRYLSNTRTHQSSTHDSDRLYWNRSILSKGMFLHLCHTIKDSNQCFGFFGSSKFRKQFSFLLIAFLGFLESILDCLNNFEGCRIIATGILFHHFINLLPHHIATHGCIFNGPIHP